MLGILNLVKNHDLLYNLIIVFFHTPYNSGIFKVIDFFI